MKDMIIMTRFAIAYYNNNLNPVSRDKTRELILENFELLKDKITTASPKWTLNAIGCFLSFHEFVEKNFMYVLKLFQNNNNILFGNNKLNLLNAINYSSATQRPDLYNPLIEEIIRRNSENIRNNPSLIFRVFLRVSELKYFSDVYFAEINQVTIF